MELNDDLLSSYTYDSAVRTPKIFDRYFSSSSSSSDDDDSNSSMEATSKRLDYMIQFLDRKLSTTSSTTNYTNNNTIASDNHSSCSNRNKSPSSSSSALPEFIGKGGGTGIFRLPVRGAVHPARPPSLEVRPRPFRESQIGSFLRTIATTQTQLWAGTENGSLHVWQFKDLYGGTEDTAPHRESVAVGSGVMCMIGDEGSRVVWSGHKDGRIRCWKMHLNSDRFREVLSWVAHRGPVLSMVMTSYGLCLLLPFASSLCISNHSFLPSFIHYITNFTDYAQFDCKFILVHSDSFSISVYLLEHAR